MIENVTKEEKKVLMKKFISGLKNDPRINQWEKEFLENVEKHVISGKLTEKQLAVLEKMKRKYVRGK